MHNNNYAIPNLVPYQQHGPPPQLVPPPISTVICCGPSEAFAQEYTETAVKLAKAEDRLQRRELKEQAYSRVYTASDQQTYTDSEHGSALPIMNCAFERVWYCISDAPLNSAPLYFIKMTCSNQLLRITERDVLCDSQFMAKLERHEGVHLTIHKRKKATLDLLRQDLNRKAITVRIRMYAGWHQDEKGNFKFEYFTNFSTHLPPHCELEKPEEFLVVPQPNPITEAVATVAAAKFWPVFHAITDPFSQSLLSLLFHSALLYTLVQKLGYSVPLSLVLFSDSANQTRYLKCLFSFFGDPTLTLDENPKDFAHSLVLRKDQTVVVEDGGRLNNKDRNTEILDSALANRSIPWKVGQEEITLPLQALLVIISSRASALTNNPDVVVLDIPPDCFDAEIWGVQENRIMDKHDYIEAFASYTEQNIPKLKDSLSVGYSFAYQNSKEGTGSKRVEMLGFFTGISLFLEEFFRFCESPALPPANIDDSLADTLIDFMCESANREYGSSPASQFISVACDYINTGRIQLVSGRCCKETDNPDIIYVDDDALSFTTSAFYCVCNSLFQSRPNVIQSLVNEKLFRGRPINDSTYMTRITVTDETGYKHRPHVYSIAKAAFGNAISIDKPLSSTEKTGMEFVLGHFDTGERAVWKNAENPHVSILGRSGSGKSFFMKKLLAQAAQQGALCLVFDYSADFTDYSPPTNIPFQRIDIQSPDFTLNPLVGDTNADICVQRLLSLLHGIFRMGNRANLALQKIAKEYLNQEASIPTVNNLLEFIYAQENLSIGLSAALEPLELLYSLVHFSDAEEQSISLDLTKPGIIILDFQAVLDPLMEKFLIELILRCIWDQRTSSKQPHPPIFCVLDECQNLAWGKDSMPLRILREGRKYNFGGWFSTQWLENREAISALGQAALQCHFRPDESRIQRLSKVLCSSRGEKFLQCQELVSSLHRGQFLWRTPDGRVVCVNVH